MRKTVWLAAALGFAPTLASAESAIVTSGVKSEVTTHMGFDSRCQSRRVTIKILDPPANGAVTTEPKRIVVAPQSARGVSQPSQCVGRTIDGVAVQYQSRPGFVGQDSFRYWRLNPDDAGDRSNMEVKYTVTVVAARADPKSEIETLNARFAELFNKGDAAGVAALYAEDAVVLPPGSGMIAGRASIEAFWKKAAETLGDAKLTAVDVKPLGENALREAGYFSLRTKSVPSQEMTGKYVVVWERVGGEWKLATDIWNEGK